MSALLENTAAEIEDLAGATIERIWISDANVGDDYEQPVVRLRVRFRPGLSVNGLHHGEYELWQDVEGNGPGYLAFVRAITVSELPIPGDRIELIAMPEEPNPIEPGTTGTVTNVVDTSMLRPGSHQIWVEWDCGEDEIPRSLALVVPPDRFRKIIERVID